MPRGFSVVAIIAAFNEADIIGTSVQDLIDQEIAVYLLDDGSTDGTAQIVEPYVGRGVIGIERLRPAEAGPGEFALKQIVRRKAQLAAELEANWFINHDADEFRESPWLHVGLKEAIHRVDALGYNAIDFASFDFRPTDDRNRTGEDVRIGFPFYSEAAVYDRVQIRCWKKTASIDLESTGGHDTQFEGRKVFPVRFISRHYPIRGQAHGDRKVFAERKPRFVDDERGRGWHVQYDDLAEGTSFIHDPCALTRFDPIGVRIDLSLRHRGVEALEQSLDGLQTERDEARADLAARSKDVERLNVELDDVRSQLAGRVDELRNASERLQELDGGLTEARAQLAHRSNELAAHRSEIAGLTSALEQRNVEVANLKAGIADFMKQLDAFRRSLSWRWTAPARAVYRLLTGR
jgi:hypothetical protein